MEIFKRVMYVALGVVLTICVFCVVVGIGCCINGVTFGQQVVNWFGSSAVKTAAENLSESSLIIGPI